MKYFHQFLNWIFILISLKYPLCIPEIWNTNHFKHSCENQLMINNFRENVNRKSLISYQDKFIS